MRCLWVGRNWTCATIQGSRYLDEVRQKLSQPRSFGFFPVTKLRQHRSVSKSVLFEYAKCELIKHASHSGHIVRLDEVPQLDVTHGPGPDRAR